MSDTNKSYRVSTKINEDKFVSVAVMQDIDTINLLSLEINANNLYRMHTSNYGCIAGRVLANGGVGIPNAKVSVFVEAYVEDGEDPVLKELYPFSTSFSLDSNGTRYNLFPDTNVTVCHTKIGTFPNKREALDDEVMNELYNRYYTYTTRTNDAGDYMIFGVPVGNRTIHTDIDLSDIGFLSQKPRDMIYKGYTASQFESIVKFKSDTNLDNLSQVITENDNIYVYPFWGSNEDDEIRITRNDINVQYKFEPTCVFIGSVVTDETSNGVQKDCVPTERMGKMDRLTTGLGTIEMIRKRPDGSVESFSVQGNQLIDGNGTWCYQIPMNLDYYMTDEYGKLVPSDDTEKGIPTRTRVRFRVSLTDYQSDYENNHTSKMLIPNNPKEYKDLDYRFGTYTTDDEEGTKSFRDLFWNKVYTVKSYIPRIQNSIANKERRFTGFKEVNVSENKNPIPYNNMRVRMNFNFVLQCAILKILLKITQFVNAINTSSLSSRKCTVLGDGICPDLENWYFSPGCPGSKLGTTLNIINKVPDTKSTDYNNKDGNSEGENFCVTNKTDYLIQCVEMNLAMEYNVIQFDFYNDWINGLLYIPRWFTNIKKKRSYFFGNFKRKAKVEACKEDTFKLTRKFVQQCALQYTTDNGGADGKYFTKVTSKKGCVSNSKQRCHKDFHYVKVFKGKGGGGFVHNEETMYGEYVYYFKPAEWLNVSNDNYTTRCLMFATDIVLLGSLDEYDKDGVPMAFRELVSSTYTMPTNLASTNMGKEGFMYGVENYGTKCSKRTYIKDKPLTTFEDTFENYRKWSKNTDYYDPDGFDPDEAPITESSGIDWGYHGPGQGGNNLSDLYFPGGHFLAISCFNAETNIKSCVNLSRICEIGSEMSQRRTIVTYNQDDSGIDYQHVVPNGLVNNNDINDSSFRRMFATLNLNGLRTKTNPETFYREYEFTPMYPNGFNGDLTDIVSESSNYNAYVGIEGSSQGDSATYRTVNEKRDEDYYLFRLGINEDDYKGVDEIETDRNVRKAVLKHYLQRNGNTVSLPVYENSFYFYFGISQGNTALDRFFKEMYGECPSEDVNDPIVNVVPYDEYFCHEGDHYGYADVVINNADTPYTIALTKKDEYGKDNALYLKLTIERTDVNIDCSQTNKEGYIDLLSHIYNHFTLTSLESGDYVLTVANSELGANDYPFSIGEDYSHIQYIVDDDVIIDGVGGPVIPRFINYNAEHNIDVDELIDIDYDHMPERGGYVEIPNVIGPDNMKDESQEFMGFAVFTNEYYTIVPAGPFAVDTEIPMYSVEVIKLAIRDYQLFDIDSLTEIEYRNEWHKQLNRWATYRIPAWMPNDDYTVIAVLNCMNGEKKKSYQMAFGNVSMPINIDFAIGDNDLTGSGIIRALGDGITTGVTSDYPYTGPNEEILTSWVASALTAPDTVVTEKQKWNIKMGLYYRETFFDNEKNGSIGIYPQGGSGEYSEFKESHTEYIISNSSTNEEIGTDTFNVIELEHAWLDKEDRESYGDSDDLPENSTRNMEAFNLPTSVVVYDTATAKVAIDPMRLRNLPILYYYIDYSPLISDIMSLLMTRAYFNGYKTPSCYRDGIKPYRYHVKDSEKTYSKLVNVPSIYRPFYFNFLLLIESNSNNIRFRFAITNPILYNGKIGEIRINNIIYENNNTTDDNMQLPNPSLMGLTKNPLHEFSSQDYIIKDRVANGAQPLYLNNRRIIENSCIQDSSERVVYRASFEVSDGIPDNYGGVISPITLSESVVCSMPSPKNGTYTEGVRFYRLEDANIENRTVSAFLNEIMQYSGNEPIYVDNMLSNEGIHSNFENRHPRNKYNTWNGIFGTTYRITPNTPEEGIRFVDITDQIYSAIYNPEPGDQDKSTWERFVKCARGIFASDQQPLVFAIYDPWTRVGHIATEHTSRLDYLDMYSDITPNQNIMSIVKVYYDSDLNKEDEAQ